MATQNEQILALSSLPENWDGYGAASPRSDILTAAIAFLQTLRHGPGYSDPDIAPTRIGGVLLSWEHGPHLLDVEFDSPERAEFAHLNRETDESVSGVLALPSRSQVPPFAFSAILSSMPTLASTGTS